MIYPFAALVGQEKLKRALLLCAINPSIGGILIRGDKGTAKSTAARGLAEVVPSIQKVADCTFNCSPNEPLAMCPTCQQADALIAEVPAPFVNLPLGATEDRVIGSLDLESVLNEKKRKLQPGLLAAAHRGILYIDEVNLLPDHLVDILLDVAAMGINTVQREGLSLSHPARFTLIGTMNPEEGNLRPQFLDRFGLMIDVEAPRDIAERTEVVRRRIAFEANPASFIAQWAPKQQALQQQLRAACALLPSVVLPDGLLTLISQLCTELGVTSLRADIVMYKTALTLAALANRTEVMAEDIRQAAELALLHRRRKKPFDDNQGKQDKLDELMEQASTQSQQAPPPPPNPKQQSKSPSPSEGQSDQEEQKSQPKPLPEEEQVFGIAPLAAVPKIEVEAAGHTPALATNGRRSSVSNAPRGQYSRAVADKNPTDLAVDATLYQALVRDPDLWAITRDDLHQKVRTGKTGNLILFVVDASGSMAASRRMEAVKGATLNLLTDAYQRRDTVGIIAFRGIEAQVLLEPTRSVELAELALRNLPTGGRTPLPHALQLAAQLLEKLDQQDALQPLLVILSDGKANVPLPGGGDAWEQTQRLASQLKEKQVPALVLDTDNDYLRLGRASELATALGATCLSLEELSAEGITHNIQIQLAGGR
ncbi:MAG: putative cobaltochelatase [Bacteroidota bacterium]